MLRRAVLVMGLAVVVLLAVGCAVEGGGIEVKDARSRMSPMMSGVGAIYLDITNATDADDALISASVDPAIAGLVEVHETFDADAHDGGMDHDGDMDHDGEMGHGDQDEMDREEGFAMMGMREIEQLDIPAGTTVELVPGGYHLMLIDLADDLVPGEEYELTLTFADAGDVTVTVEVRDEV